jgi:Cytochrome c554 and c-prime
MKPLPLDGERPGRALQFLLIAYVGSWLGCSADERAEPATYLSHEELLDPLTCARCHQKHYDEWASSMHAYASDDPLFVAMNQRGQREANIGKFCVQCHAPMAVRSGATEDGLNLDTLPQSLKGVTCYFCHSVDGVEGTHNNPLHLASDDVMRGEFMDPVPNAAHRSIYSPLHDRDRLESAQLCGTCHDIENDHATRIERTFEEWQGSVFAQPVIGTTCGQCHMDQSTNLEPAAQAPGVFSRRLHSHRFPGVDLPLRPAPGEDALRTAVQTFLDTSLQSALCVRGTPTGAQIQVVLDNVAAGHRWPSGSAQDRRAWVEVTAYAGDAPMFQSGSVPVGTSVTQLTDPNLWLIRDCLFDAQGDETHMFWEAADYETNLLPGQFTFDSSDPRYYQTHVVQLYPRAESRLPMYPDRVTMRVHLQPFGLDVFDDIVASGDLVDGPSGSVAELRDKLVPLRVGEELEWTAASVTERYLESGLPVACVSTTNLSAAADKVPAVNHQRCTP